VAVQLDLDLESSELSQVTFCVFDVETTGGSSTQNRITEIGAVKIRGGEVLGEFRTFVNAHHWIPPNIVVLTGITQSLLVDAPAEEFALASFLEFAHGSVPVGHNVRFDLGFVNATASRVGLEGIQTEPVDTLTLSRKLLSGEIPNHKLGTIAQYLRVAPRTAHRALDDARTTVDILHCLLERAGTIGATHLSDLHNLQAPGLRVAGNKLKLTTTLPHRPGIYRFHDQTGAIIYVGTSRDIKARVRSYFSSEQRRKVPRMLQETTSISYVDLDCPLSAAVLEVREIAHHSPRFNARGTYKTPIRYLRIHPKGTITIDTGLRAVETGSYNEGIGPFFSSKNILAVRDLINEFDLGARLSALPASNEDATHECFIVGFAELAAVIEHEMVSLAQRQAYERAEALRTQALRLLQLISGAYLHRSLSHLSHTTLTHRLVNSTHSHTLNEGHFQLPAGLLGSEDSPQQQLRRSGERLIVRMGLLRGELRHENLDIATVIRPLGESRNLFTPRLQREPPTSSNSRSVSLGQSQQHLNADSLSLLQTPRPKRPPTLRHRALPPR
jgi:DNA polymerase-3 subunit epsilon